MTTDRDFVGSEKIDGGGACTVAGAYLQKTQGVSSEVERL